MKVKVAVGAPPVWKLPLKLDAGDPVVNWTPELSIAIVPWFASLSWHTNDPRQSAV
jgi:hypothetical protein